jgi:hypothetical protein
MSYVVLVMRFFNEILKRVQDEERGVQDGDEV